ncbi:hypothetical protein VYU27_006560 [Nannochloropsis oceanica]
MAASSPPPLSMKSLAFPVMYRCLLLANSEGEICGVRLGLGHNGHSVVSEVLSESVQELCQVAEGDILTHIDGVTVLGGRHRDRRQGKGWEGKGGGVGGVTARLTVEELLQRQQVPYTRQRMNKSSLHPQQQQQQQQQQRHHHHHQHRQYQHHPSYSPPPSSVIELRLIRASSLPKSSTFSPSFSTASSPPTPFRHLPVYYYETHPKDTLESIAQFFHISPQDIRRNNRDYFPSGEKAGGIHPGILLKIPNPTFFEEEGREDEVGWKEEYVEEEEEDEGSSSLLASSLSSSSPSSSSSACSSRWHNARAGVSPTSQRVVPSSSFILPRTPPSTPPSLPRSLPPLPLRILHDVRDNESVDSLARRLNVQIMDLRKWNRSLFPTGETVNFLPAGTRVVVFAAPVAVSGGPGRQSERERGREGVGKTRPIRIVEGGEEGEVAPVSRRGERVCLG